MSKPGTTWFKNSRRKFAAVVAGAAILTGVAGVAVPQPEADASTWSIEAPSDDMVFGGFEIVVDGDTDPDPAPEPTPIKKPIKIKIDFRSFAKSTWS